jgi:hypothetical protein
MIGRCRIISIHFCVEVSVYSGNLFQEERNFLPGVRHDVQRCVNTNRFGLYGQIARRYFAGIDGPYARFALVAANDRHDALAFW